MKTVRIVAVADTHMQHNFLDVPDGDIFVHAGDMCQRGYLEELAHVARWIRSLPHRHKIVIAGNHDWAFVDSPKQAQALFRDVHYLQDSEITVEGLRFYGSPWQPEFCNWAFNLPRGPELAAVWAKIPTGLDVLITHGPPFGYGDRIHHTHVNDARVGCADLRRRLLQAKPRLHMFGHIHYDGGLWQRGSVTIANVTTAECVRDATVIDVGQNVTPVIVPLSLAL